MISALKEGAAPDGVLGNGRTNSTTECGGLWAKHHSRWKANEGVYACIMKWSP
ncbi:uncharacterized protein MYCFIDRAFT_211535 [Pseudocercospora fijiensis CIRAD86]|uniref:Uncharacterized protein n=1 Tax=Pseudocercospora fijiensis (strain CIRAD86) TaxID=383855 RepID=M2ZSQ1_PSEFD|nr:uncharacterized protein MYCFIDRAFT_211535 [Pseudocercospora fijiensis CIRAD86]EME82044.1 hypothetical protein MYCFIDRAFT_211535 [Pseudocercospora fijiensis CIRAD86]